MASNFISWTSFFGLSLLLLLIWCFTIYTPNGRKLIQKYTLWSREQWLRLLCVLMATLFIMVNPIYHLIGIGVAVGLYLLFVDNSTLKQSFSRKKTSETPISFSPKQRKNYHLAIACKAMEKHSLPRERFMLDKCLFSFPYIVNTHAPDVHYTNETYHIDVYLADKKYHDSFLNYLGKAGFDILTKK